MKRTILSVSILSLLVFLILPGCGNGRPKLAQVKGVVLLDGKPIEGAMVLFQRVSNDSEKFQRPSSGVTNAAGEFTVRTYDANDGLPYGKYQVGVEKREIVGKPPVNPGEETNSSVNITYKWVVPKSYADPASSTLTAEVTSEGISPAEFSLTTNGQKPQIELVGPRARANDP